MTTTGYRIPLLAPGDEITMKEWRGPGVGWVDPAKERKRRGRQMVYRRAAKSWSPRFAARVAGERFRNQFLSRMASSLGAPPPAGFGRIHNVEPVWFDSYLEASLLPAVTSAVFSVAIEAPPPTDGFNSRLRRRYYLARYRLSDFIGRAARALERLADRI